MSIAESIDELQYQFGRRLPGPPSTRLPPRGPTSGRGGSDSTTVPMDLSNIESTTSASNNLHDQISEDHVSTGTGELNNVNAYRGPLTPALRETLRREGRCFYCREKGHLLNDCPRRKRRNPNGSG
eukprot:Nk52_evm1s920 gene=Nk52_evmTU1s920